MAVKYSDLMLRLKQCALVNLAATVVAQAFNLASYGTRTLTVEDFVESFVYSNSIGSLVSSIIFFVAPRLDRNPTVIRLVKVFALILIATFFGIMLARFILGLIFPKLVALGLFPGWQNFVFSLGISLTFGFGVYFFEFSQAQLREKALDEEKAKTLASEAQLASLESRIHPHFLFNTLNSIAALIRENPRLAERTVEKLSALLRYSLDSDARSLVSIEQELEITEKYLEIEKIRFEQRLDYRIECDEIFLETKIPPLALQTLVENSIKHVASKTSKKTEIAVVVKRHKAGISIEVCDNGTGFEKSSLKANHGLDNLQKRLQTLFGAKAKLHIAEKETNCVQLQLPVENKL